MYTMQTRISWICQKKICILPQDWCPRENRDYKSQWALSLFGITCNFLASHVVAEKLLTGVASTNYMCGNLDAGSSCFGSRSKKRFQIRIQCFGTMSPSSFVLYHLFGAIIIFFLYSESHAAHQLNELLAIMKCLQADISCKSSGALSGPLISTNVWGWLVIIFRLHHSSSSEKI